MNDHTPPAPPGGLWRAPLALAAVAVTSGVVFDHFFGDTLGAWGWLFYALSATAALLAWIFSRTAETSVLSLCYACLGMAALGALYHDVRLHRVARDDLALEAASTARIVRLRGLIEEEPGVRPSPRSGVSLRTVLRVREREQDSTWSSCSGRVQLVVSERDRLALPNVHLGDELEVQGRLVLLRGASNPGEDDLTEHLHARGIRTILLVGVRDEVEVVGRQTPPVELWPAIARSHALQALNAGFPEPHQDRVRALAATLLLGEDEQLSQEEWEIYKQTGVVHVLAISGQHLAILGAFLWLILRLLRMRRRRGALVVALVLVAYALLAGGRPPVLRAAIMVCAFCGGAMLRRSSNLTNDFSLAWLAVLLWNPADVFSIGCQLSFLSVAVIYFGTAQWFRWEWFQEPNPLRQLLDEERPWPLRWLRRVGWWIVQAYLLSTVLWLAVLPLLIFRYNLVPGAALLIGPPVVLMASIALITGFTTLPIMVLCPPLSPFLAWPTYPLLWLCQALVTWAASWPTGPAFVRDIPLWWVAVWYIGLLAALIIDPVRQRWRWLIPAAVAWLCVGLAAWLAPSPADELRCTFLSVGHGGCTVLETPDGRVILYDAGALGASEVAKHQIAPFLWSRGVRRIDEVFLSHADADHFNGLPFLVERFAIGRVTLTPSFADKPTPTVKQTLTILKQRDIPTRTVKAGDHLSAGTVQIEVLHPPEQGPEGIENVRSLVLLIHHEEHRILLTGDLSGRGLKQVLARPAAPVDVLMAPHHGSASADPAGLAAWARPTLVVASEGPPRTGGSAESYTRAGAIYLTTWERGAITVRSRPNVLTVDCFRGPFGTGFPTTRGPDRRY